MKSSSAGRNNVTFLLIRCGQVYGTGMLMIFIFLSGDSSLVVVFQTYFVIDVNTSCTLK